MRIPASRSSLLTKDRSGVAALEFALSLPLMAMLLIGTIQCSILFHRYLELSNGVSAATRVFAMSRGVSTPWTKAKTLFSTAATNVNATTTLTFAVEGTACTSDVTCSAAIAVAAGGTAKISGSYPCTLHFMGINFIPSCSLVWQTTGRIE